MLTGKALVLETTDQRIDLEYQEYLLRGGLLCIEDYQFSTDILVNNLPIPEDAFTKCPCASQICGIAQTCGIELSLEEIYTYRTLRRKINTVEDSFETPEGTKNCWQMSDTELAGEIFKLSDPSGSKFKTLVERFPNVFNKGALLD
jgi:hypothetical protein